jgi:hypothetical protein
MDVQSYIKNELWVIHEYPVFEFLLLFICMYQVVKKYITYILSIFFSLTRLMVKVAIEDLFMGCRLH